MARLSPRLIVTGTVLGVLLGLLYSRGQGVISRAHRVLPSGAQRPRTRSARLRTLPLGRPHSRPASASATAIALGVRGVVQRPESAGDEEREDPGLVVVARPQGASSASESVPRTDPEQGAATEATTGTATAETAAAADTSAGAGAGAGAGGSLVSAAELEEYKSGRKALPRVCGSPAVDGYAHVKPECLEASPTNKLWWSMHPNGGKSGEGLECHIEHEVSLDGLAVGWGIGNKKKSPEECCQACRDHVPGPAVGGPFGNLPCNVWVYCNAPVCYEADAHSHSQGDCWLKFSEAPQNVEVNARQAFTKEFRQRHPDAPPRCQWVSGILVPPGQTLTNGTWGPRFDW